MPEISAQSLLHSQTVIVSDTHCRGTLRHPSVEEATRTTQLVFPYRGVFVRHLGQVQTVAEANQVLFFNATEGYRVSHPLAGGDASMGVIVHESLLFELAPRALLRIGPTPVFHQQRLRIDARTQTLVALLRHSLHQGTIEPLEAESLALILVRRALGPRTTHTAGGTAGRQRIVDRAKLVLASDLARRFTLSEIAAEVRVSPIYLTQLFQQVEGIPLYRYHLRLRLARALDMLSQCDDLTTLSMDLGFSSHSHFTAAFRQAYGRTPSEFRDVAVHRSVTRTARRVR